MRSVLIVFLFVACGSESKPPPPKQEQASVVVDAAKPDAPQPPRHAYMLRTKLELPDLDSVQDLVVQNDGTLLVIGQSGVVRVGTDWALDTTFGSAGIAPISGLRGHRASVDGKGRIVIAGDGRERTVLVRLLPDGKLDTSFGKRGRVELDHPDSDSPSAVFASGDDVVAIGIHEQGKRGRHYEQYFARFDERGAKKQSVFFDCIPNSREFVTRARVDGDGYLLVGYAYNTSPDDSGIFLARVRSDGTLDPAFGDQGVTRLRSQKLQKPVAWTLAQLPNGDILAGGEGGAQDPPSVLHRGYVARFDKHGRPVTTWGDNGVAWAQSGSHWISFVAPTGDHLIAVERFKPGLLVISTTGQAGETISLEGEDKDRYDEAVMLENGDLVVASHALIRFAKK